MSRIDAKELRAKAYARASSERRWTCDDSEELLGVLDRLEAVEAELVKGREMAREAAKKLLKQDRELFAYWSFVRTLRDRLGEAEKRNEVEWVLASVVHAALSALEGKLEDA